MIRLIETKNFRSLKSISQPLSDFHVLVGANASGKTTFLDVISFIADLVTKGVDFAIEQRTRNFKDLTFAGKGGSIELAIEMELPEDKRNPTDLREFDSIRYQVTFGIANESGEHCIFQEWAGLLKSDKLAGRLNGASRMNFPENQAGSEQAASRFFLPELAHTVLKRDENGHVVFFPEQSKPNGSFWSPFKLNLKNSALGNLPADTFHFPASSWLKDLLTEGVQLFILDSLNIRQASRPGQSQKFKTDGSNLPWVIEALKKRDMNAYRNWVEHLRTALPDIDEVFTVERADDRHRYLKIRYNNSIEVPSWLVSDGTLRLLALTLPAYLPDFEGVYLIEEPENGIHPRAIETVFQSLSSVYNAQILLATHSPVILSMVELKDVLCFAKTQEGITDIVRGTNHPSLKSWQGGTNLSVLFAAGVLS